MKTTRLLFTMVFIVTAFAAYAQETTTTPPPLPPPPEPVYGSNVSKIRFGAYLAPTISWMHPTASKSDDGNFSVASNGSKVGFMYGLMAEYFFAPNYGLVTGIQINSTGGKMNATNIDQTKNQANQANKVLKADFDYRLQYLEIPLALKLKTDNINRFKFFGQLGITAGINIGKKASYSVDYTDAAGAEAATPATGDKIKITGELGSIAPVLFEMNIGAGAEYPLSNKLTAYFGLFFNNGFAPDATAPQKFDSDKLGYGKASFKDGNTRLNNFALRIGLFF